MSNKPNRTGITRKIKLLEGIVKVLSVEKEKEMAKLFSHKNLLQVVWQNQCKVLPLNTIQRQEMRTSLKANTQKVRSYNVEKTHLDTYEKQTP